MKNLLKRAFAREYRDRPLQEILAAPLIILKGVSQQTSILLAQRYDIHSVADLIQYWPQPVEINPAILEGLWCFLHYPGYDPGPPCKWEYRFRSAPLNHYLTHSSGRFRTQFGPVFYRGRLDGSARVLIVAQDPSTDELIAQRTLVGDAGQKLQHLLNKLGLTRSYIMLNTFLFGIRNQFDAEMQGIALEAPILDYRNMLFDRVASENGLQAILAFGAAAHFSLDHWPGSGLHNIVDFVHPSAPDAVTLPNWNSNMGTAQSFISPDSDGHVDLTPYGPTFTAADSVAIPRYDLPFGLPTWQGTLGTHSHRQGDTEIVWTA
jgi:hypothetical protein